jgi:hypothetical protein
MCHKFTDKPFPFFEFLRHVPTFDSNQRRTGDVWGRLAAGSPTASTHGGAVLGHSTSVNGVGMTRGNLEQPGPARAQAVRSGRAGDGALTGGATGEGRRKGRRAAVKAWCGVESREVRLVLEEEEERQQLRALISPRPWRVEGREGESVKEREIENESERGEKVGAQALYSVHMGQAGTHARARGATRHCAPIHGRPCRALGILKFEGTNTTAKIQPRLQNLSLCNS